MRETDRQTEKERKSEREKERKRKKDREKSKERKKKERERERERERKKDRPRERQKEIGTMNSKFGFLKIFPISLSHAAVTSHTDVNSSFNPSERDSNMGTGEARVTTNPRER